MAANLFTRHLKRSLTTDDAIWHCLTLAAFYQLAQFVLKIGFSFRAKKVEKEEVCGFQQGVAAVLHGCRMALVLKLAGPFLILLALPLTLQGHHFWYCRQEEGVLAVGRALTIESSLMSGCDQSHEPREITQNTFGLIFQCQSSKYKWKYRPRKVFLQSNNNL